MRIYLIYFSWVGPLEGRQLSKHGTEICYVIVSNLDKIILQFLEPLILINKGFSK
jgi:hypothetical protein